MALNYLCLHKLNFTFITNFWKMNKLKFTIIFIPIIFFLAGCSASTSTRYEKTEKTNGNGEENKSTINEDFDITQYKTKIEIEKTFTNEELSDAWYGYEGNSEDFNVRQNLKIVETVDGYRVLVVATDDMETANSVRADILAKIKRKEVYISFEPPFYKVKVGDFTDITEPNNLKFKLNQLGYTEARVIKETINIFEE
jgi:hypothetical protein